MIHNENDIIDFESCIRDAFELLHRAVDMVEDHEDHCDVVGINVVGIKRLIESKILCHEQHVHPEWLKTQVEEAWKILDEFADRQEALNGG